MRQTMPKTLSLLLLAALPATGAGAATELASVTASPDITTIFDGLEVRDQGVFTDDLPGGMAVAISLGDLPEPAAVDGFHDPGDGTLLFSLDTWTDLGGLPVTPADVVRWDGSAWTVAFDALAAGVPTGANTDALAVDDGTGDLLLSFDVDVDLPGGPYADEDVVRWDGSTFASAFDGSKAHVPAGADVDAVHRLSNGNLLLSFDVGGTLPGEQGPLAFADEDLLEIPTVGFAIWELAYDGSAEHPSWVAADLDAVTVGIPPSVLEIPTLSPPASILLALLLGAAGLRLAGRGRRGRTAAVLLLALPVAFSPASARAADGVLEIHRTCIATGCFPGDGPGFPVEVAESGSYLLTSDLVVPDENTTAIRVTGARVSIDLGGFSISGPTFCTGIPTTCFPGGSGVGIDFEPGTFGSAANGKIQGMGGTGIEDGNGNFENLLLHSNGGDGISASGTIHGCRVTRNGDAGIACNSALVLDNLVTFNGRAGISCTGHPVIRGNRVTDNGNAGTSPGIDGANGLVTGNLIVLNRAAGLTGTSDLAYGDNVLRDNNSASGSSTPANQVTQGVQIGPNLCQGVPCP